MPIYEYECPSCNHRFEKLVKLSAPEPACPECNGTHVRKLVSASSFVLKGGGWYRDHYGLKSGGDSGSSSSSGGSSSAGSSSTASSTAAAPAGGASSSGSSGGSTGSSGGGSSTPAAS